MGCLFHDSEAAETGERSARRLPHLIPRGAHSSIPDVIFLPNLDPNRFATHHLSQLTSDEKSIVCLEVGHTADDRVAETLQTKTLAHDEWFRLLEHEGWTVKYFPIVVTHSGLVTDTALHALHACSVPTAQAERTVAKIARSALNFNHTFKTARQLKLKEMTGAQNDQMQTG